MAKRIISLVLCMAMVISLLPGVAGAAEITDPTVVEVSTEESTAAETTVVEPTVTETAAAQPTVTETTAGTEAPTEAPTVVTEAPTVPETAAEPTEAAPAVVETTAETVPEPEAPAVYTPEDGQLAAILSRDDGMWLFPLDKEFYGNISDWNGCRGENPCLFCGEVHNGCGDANHGQAWYGAWGLDISVPEGTPVYAPANGTIWWTDRAWDSLGYTAILEHPAEEGWAYYTVLSHLEGVDLPSGTAVAVGESIARTGSSGAEDEAAHLVYALFMAPAGLGARIAADPERELEEIQAAGWLEESQGTGMINNNPAVWSQAQPETEDGAVLEAFSRHTGTVGYTFDVESVTAGETTEPEQPEENQAAANEDTQEETTAPTEETVPAESQGDAAGTEPGPVTYGTIVASGTCGENLTWTLDDAGVLTISGSGAMADYPYEASVPWYPERARITQVSLPEGLSNIGTYTFYECSSLASITIPDSVTSIGDSAFFDCGSLTRITIPESVTNIGESAFSWCSSLTSITIPDGVTSINFGTFSGCSNLTSITIPDGVTSIGGSAFSRCSSLTSIIIPDGVTSIGNYAFYRCSSLTSITIPDGVTSIDTYAFEGCSSLTSITIPDSVTSIGDRIFYGCSNLTSIAIPDGVSNIGNYVFYGCNSLASITIPGGVTNIGNYAFYGCSSLTSITIPDSVTSIGHCAFEGCSSLTNITIPDGVTSVGYQTFSGCISLASITIPDGVTSIGSHAFSWCRNLTSITIPGGVTSISYRTFYECSSLTSIAIPDGVRTIQSNAFMYCSNLAIVILPGSLTNIDNSVFVSCDRLADIYYRGTEQMWSQIEIGTNNDAWLDKVRFSPEAADVEDIPLSALSLVVYANENEADKETEKFVLCPNVTVRTDAQSVLTDDKGQATISAQSGLVTFEKEGYVSRSLTLEQLKENSSVYLQKESKYPVINALWMGETDLLREEVELDPLGEESITITPEVYWGEGEMKSLVLYQNGNSIPLTEGENTVIPAKSLDITEKIYLVATNTEGVSSRKAVKIANGEDPGLNFSFKLGDSLSFTLPDSLGPLGDMKFSLGLSQMVPVEVSVEDGKVFAAIGFRQAGETEEKEGKTVWTKKTCQGVKDLLEKVSDAEDAISRYQRIRDAMQAFGGSLATVDGSFGAEAGISIMGFAEGYLDANHQFVLTSSGGIIVLDGAVNGSKPFVLGPVPMFFEFELSAEVEAQFNLFLNQKIKEFTPKIELKGDLALSGGVGVGLAKVLSVSGGLKGSLPSKLNLDEGKIQYFQLRAVLDWYAKLKVLFASFSIGPGQGAALLTAADGYNPMFDASQYTMDDLSYLSRGSSFMGRSMAGISTYAVNNNAPFVSNAYEGADPQAVSFSDGSRLAVWIGYNSAYAGADALNLYFSYYDRNHRRLPRPAGCE